MLGFKKLPPGEVGGEAAAVLEGKCVLVTGASSGIGRAIALRCARAGADLAITYRNNQNGAEATAREIRGMGRRAEVLRTDISRLEDIEALVNRLGQAFSRVDVWVNNAGADILTGDAGRLTRLQKLDMVLAVDLRGTVLASWAAVDLMRKQGGGIIINMAWDHVGQGMEGENPAVYSAAKGGVASFSRSLARDVAPDIRVNILAPGFIETAFGEEANPRFRQKVIDMTPLGRWGKPDDVAGAAVFLASDDSAFLTGQMIMVNGGVVM
jgi:3-oxoacyl-[acyl-carrier protein] reductase